MKTIVPVVTAAVLALALMPASAAPMHHKRHTKAATAAQPQIACTVVGCMPIPLGCHPEMATRRAEHQPVLMWRYVRTTRFTETTADRNVGAGFNAQSDCGHPVLRFGALAQKR